MGRKMSKNKYYANNIWNVEDYLQHLIPEMLQDLKDNRQGSPSYLGENYTNEEGIQYFDEYHMALEEFEKLYGAFGDKLQTEDELENITYFLIR